MNIAARTTVWLGALTASLAGLLAAGDRLAGPPALDPGATWAWLQVTDPATTTFALLRLGAIAVVGYLLVATLVLLAAQATRIPGLITASTHLTLPSARRLIRHAVGAGMALGLTGTGAPMLAGATPPTPATTTTVSPSDAPPILHVVGDDLVLVNLGPAAAAAPDAPDPASGPGPSTTGAAGLPASTTVPVRPPPGPLTTADPGPADPTAAPPPTASSDPTDTATTTSPPVEPTVAPAVPTERPPELATPDEPVLEVAPATGPHTIIAGEHLWGVSAQALAAAWGHDPGPGEIAAYLQRLIERNRSVLAVPDNPDLVFPGQVFVLPAVTDR